MPESNLVPGYRDPFTPSGIRLGVEESFGFRLHEVGCLTLSTQWNYAGIRSPFWRLYWNDRPGAWIECAGRRFDLEPTRLVLVPSHTVFDTHGSLEPVTHFWIHFSLHPDLTTRDNVPFGAIFGKRLARQMVTLTKQVRLSTPSTVRRLHHLCSALLHEAFADPEIDSHPPKLPLRLHALLKQIETSLSTPPSVTDLALLADMSRGGFIRWFKHHMEVTPAHYVLSRRIDHACRFLKFSSATIEEISEKLGFSNRAHFSRVFQRKMGAGPALFRKS